MMNNHQNLIIHRLGKHKQASLSSARTGLSIITRATKPLALLITYNYTKVSKNFTASAPLFESFQAIERG